MNILSTKLMQQRNSSVGFLKAACLEEHNLHDLCIMVRVAHPSSPC